MKRNIHNEYERFMDRAISRISRCFVLISLKNIRKSFILFVLLFKKYDKETKKEAKELAQKHIKYYREKSGA